MSEKDIFEKLLQIVKDSLDDDSFDYSKINMETDLYKEIITNSISGMYIALSIEDKFNIEFDNESLKKLKTVGDFVELIRDKTN